MTRKRRLLLVLLVLLVLLPVGGFLFLRSFFTEERILALLQPRIEAALGRPVHIGAARLQAWPLSVQLSALQVAGETPEAAAFLELDALQCRVDPGPLLRRKLLIQSLVLDSLRVRLHQRPDSTWNLPAPAPSQASPATAGDTAGEQSTPLALTIRSLVVRHAVLDIDQDPSDFGMRLPLDAELQFDISRDLSRVRVAGDITANGVAGTRGAWSRLRDVRVHLQPTVQIDVPDSSAQLESVLLQVQDLQVQVQGNVRMQDGAPFGRLQTSSEALDLASVLSLIPPSMAPALATTQATGTVGMDLQIDLQGAGPPQIEGGLQLQGGQLQTAELPEPLRDIDAQVEWRGDRIDIRKVAARFLGDVLEMRGTVTDPLVAERTRYDVEVDGTLSLAAASALATLPPGTRLEGAVQARCRAQGMAQDPQSMQLTGTLQLEDVVVHSPQSLQPIRIAGSASLEDESLLFDDATVRIGESTARLRGKASPLQPGVPPRLEIRGDVERLDLDAIVPPKANLPAAASDTSTGAAAPATSPRLLPAHPPAPVDVRVRIAETHFQLAQWNGMQVQAEVGPQGFRVQARVDSLQRDALTVRAMQLDLQGDSLQARGTLRAGRTHMGRLQANGMRSDIRVEGTTVTLPDMQATLYDGALRGTSTLHLQDPQAPQYDLQLDMDNVEAGALLADVLPGGQWMSGRLHGSSSWSSAGAAPTALRGNLTATGEARAAAGTLYRFPLLDSVTRTLRLQEVPQWGYRDLIGRFSVADGRIQIPQLQLAADDFEAHTLGSVGLDGKLDMKLHVVLSEEQTKRYVRGDLGSAVQRLFADDQGRVVLDFDVGGNLTDPKLQADLESTAGRSGLQALGAQELGRLLDDVLPQDEGGLGDALRRGLGGLLGNKKKPPAPPDSTRRP